MVLRRSNIITLLIILTLLLFVSHKVWGRPSGLKLPKHFKIDLYAIVPGARSMALGPNGILYVGTKDIGRVYAVQDKDADHYAEDVTILYEDLKTPNGVAYKNNTLYIAEISRILRAENIDNLITKPPQLTPLTQTFPDKEHHGWKFIRFGPDEQLYIPVGAPCNVCNPGKDLASIFKINPKGSASKELVAKGIRNTVGFDFEPSSRQLWFTENGRDNLGDDIPPEELNTVTKKEEHFGYPFCHAGEIKDPEFGSLGECKDSTAPQQKIPAHVAALGMRFYTGTMFPKEYRNQIFIAEHGSWNRKEPQGYRVSLVRVRNSKATKYEIFAEGWLSKEKVVGRPVDIEVLDDGSLLVSDDQAGAVYRISYKK